MAICCVSLILAPLDEVSKTVETGNNGGLSGAKKPSVFYLTGQVVTAYRGRERIYAFLTRDFGGSRRRDFAKLNLHLPACRSLRAGRALFEQPGKDDFFSGLLI